MTVKSTISPILRFLVLTMWIAGSFGTIPSPEVLAADILESKGEGAATSLPSDTDKANESVKLANPTNCDKGDAIHNAGEEKFDKDRVKDKLKKCFISAEAQIEGVELSRFSIVDPTESRYVKVTAPLPGSEFVKYEVAFLTSDLEIAESESRVFENIPLKHLKPGYYNYVVTIDGEISFGRIENSWEIGVRHLQLAENRPIILAGAIRIGESGGILFNLESGTFSRLIARHFGNPLLIKCAAAVFGVDKKYYTNSIKNFKDPSPKELKKYCESQSGSFKKREERSTRKKREEHTDHKKKSTRPEDHLVEICRSLDGFIKSCSEEKFKTNHKEFCSNFSDSSDPVPTKE